MSRELARKQARRQRIARGEEGNGISINVIAEQMKAMNTRPMPPMPSNTSVAPPTVPNWADKEIR